MSTEFQRKNIIKKSITASCKSIIAVPGKLKNRSKIEQQDTENDKQKLTKNPSKKLL